MRKVLYWTVLAATLAHLQCLGLVDMDFDKPKTTSFFLPQLQSILTFCTDYDIVCVVDGHLGPLSAPESPNSPHPASEVLIVAETIEMPDITIHEKTLWNELLQVRRALHEI